MTEGGDANQEIGDPGGLTKPPPVVAVTEEEKMDSRVRGNDGGDGETMGVRAEIRTIRGARLSRLVSMKDRDDAIRARSFVACEALARSHYENFTVVSRVLLPADPARDLAAVYAFCRMADDAADEIDDDSESLAALGVMRQQLETCAAGGCDEAIWGPALGDVIRRHDVPLELFGRLLDAFERDRRQDRYRDWADLLSYCHDSANPVGRIVLHISGHGARRDFGELCLLSDRICTGLQLANHWQDVVGDLSQRGRVYIPQDLLDQFGVEEADLRTGAVAVDRFVGLMRELVGRARALFDEGAALCDLVDPAIRPSVQLFRLGGVSILHAIEQQGFDVLRQRPAVSSWWKGVLVGAAWLSRESGIDVVGWLAGRVERGCSA
ncbi:MAG: squalene synthase HpnC [Planctomycetes bacterium]|nr:squalene synthase HpnC [Planctomycetota bacterium]